MNDQVQVYFHSQQPYTHVSDEDLSRYDTGRLAFPNTFFDPQKAHALYNQYHEQYALARRGRSRRHYDQRAPLRLLEHETLG